MTTLGTMLDDIADEISRTDLETQTRKCIKSAIKHYQRKRFYFLEDYSQTFNTVANQEYYGAADNSYIPGYAEVDAAVITVSGSRTPLTVRPKEWFDVNSSTTTSMGIPSDIGYYAQQIRLYPIPQTVYSIRLHGLKRLDDITQTASSNAFFTEAFELIKSSAKRRLFTDYLKNDEDATRAGLNEKLELNEIVSETILRGSTNIKPSQF